VRAALPEVDTRVAERGYLGATPDWPLVPPQTVAVGHSAGMLELLADLPPGCAGLVAINGFSRFAQGPDYPAGVPHRVMERMIHRLEQDPEGTVAAFRDRCGADRWGAGRRGTPASAGPAQPDRLRNGLAALATLDGRAALQASRVPVLALASALDPIATPEMTRACFKEAETVWHPADGHMLPLVDPLWCADQLRRFAA
jgi:pimeloyl-[acyl-carrier protein] methyl ester esterase